MKAEEAQHTEKIQELARRISQFESEKAMKDTTLKSEELRRQREFEKARRPLEQRQRELERKITELDHTTQSALRSKESQIKTLMTRLELRRERLKSDQDRKSQELNKLKADLLQRLEMTKGRWQDNTQKRAREYEAHVQKLAELEASLKEVDQATSGLRESARLQIQQERQAMEMRLADYEKSFAAKQAEWDNLLAAKEREMAAYLSELGAADSAINDENEKRKVWVAFCQSLSRDLQNVLRGDATDERKIDSTVGDLLRQGVEAFEAGRHPEALSLLSQCVEREPRWEAAWQFRALTLEALGLRQEAIRAAKTVLQINPDSQVIREWLRKLAAPSQDPGGKE
jgi:chromosome segregation ATPase